MRNEVVQGGKAWHGSQFYHQRRVPSFTEATPASATSPMAKSWAALPATPSNRFSSSTGRERKGRERQADLMNMESTG